MPCC
ncbi:unnamed protein product [Cuscuta europaea]